MRRLFLRSTSYTSGANWVWKRGERITGFVDLALERAYHYRAGGASEPMPLPEELASREAEARFNELDQLKLSIDRLDARIERLACKVNVTP